MNTSPRPWRQRRSIRAILTALLLIAAAVVIAIIRSDTSQIIIYNHSDASLDPLTVRACGQEFVLSQISDEGSVRLRLQKRGGESSIELLSPSTGWRWEGSYIEPRGGYLVFIHIRRGMEVETSTQISAWQHLVSGREAGD